MADKTSIEWTSATWNPVRGCTRVSPGCGGPNNEGGCYAEKIAARFSGPGQPFHGFAKRTTKGGRWTGKMALVPDMLKLPLRWKMPRKIFVNSMSDLFHEGLTFDDIVKVFAVMAIARRHTFQVLTKRSARMLEFTIWLGTNKGHSALMRAVIALGYSVDDVVHYLPLPNVWLGVSVEDQPRADERIPDLLRTLAAVRWVSGEPLLGRTDFTTIKVPDDVAGKYAGHGHTFNALQAQGDLTLFAPPNVIDWIVTGGESGGARSRPAHPDWFRFIRNQCQEFGVAYFHKQNGDWAPGECADHPATKTERIASWNGDGWDYGSLTPQQSETLHRDDEPDVYFFGKKKAGNKLDGVVHQQWPA